MPFIPTCIYVTLITSFNRLYEGRRSASVFAVTPATRTPTARPTHAPPTLAARTPSARTTVGLQCASVPLNTSATLTSRAGKDKTPLWLELGSYH